MTQANTGEEESVPQFPSIDAAEPVEEGGTEARIGFNYQDEVSVGLLLDMLEDPCIQRIQCESHDDVVVVRTNESAERLVEFVQVKGSENDKFWSVADLCRRTDAKIGSSLFESSLGRDRLAERSTFRIVTLRPVVKELEFLSFPIGKPGREEDSKEFISVLEELESRCPGAQSKKSNDRFYWLSNAIWDVRHTEEAISNANKLRLLKYTLSKSLGLAIDHVEQLLEDLRLRVKNAGKARWKPDRDKKILQRNEVIAWIDIRAEEIRSGSLSPSGGKLRGKMAAAALPSEMIELAVELRRDYSDATRRPRYMGDDEDTVLQRRVKAEVMSLRAQFVAGRIQTTPADFHALCLERVSRLDGLDSVSRQDATAYVQGCMYDIVDRCLLKFESPAE